MMGGGGARQGQVGTGVRDRGRRALTAHKLWTSRMRVTEDETYKYIRFGNKTLSPNTVGELCTQTHVVFFSEMGHRRQKIPIRSFVPFF